MIALLLAAVLASPPTPPLCMDPRVTMPPAVAAERLPDGRIVEGDVRALMAS